MTVKELRKRLELFPDNMLVFVTSKDEDLDHGLLGSVQQQDVRFSDNSTGDTVEAYETVVVLDEL